MSDVDHFPELAERLQTIRERIRKRLEQPRAPLPAPRAVPTGPLRESLAASASLASAVGQVNPRPPGLGNELMQSVKRTQARMSEWQLRPQREFNRAVAGALGGIGDALDALGESLGDLRQAIEQRDHRRESAGHDLDALCEHVTRQRWAFEGALARHAGETDQLRQSLREMEQEVQVLRQRLAAHAKAQVTRGDTHPPMPSGSGATAESSQAPIPVDYFQLERYFRGTEEAIRKRQRFYVPMFDGRKNVLDIACGRGEFLELMRDAGVEARGVDLDADMVGRCLEKNLNVVQADVFVFLEGMPEASLDGIFSAQFVEHLEPGVYLRLISLCVEKLAPGGVLAFETQNPECLAIFSQSFFLDPTHVRPIPSAQLRFAFLEAGLERVSTYPLSPAAESLPLIPPLPDSLGRNAELQAYNAAVAKFNDKFFGGMDYAVIGYRPMS